jgi:hypothetical protein
VNAIPSSASFVIGKPESVRPAVSENPVRLVEYPGDPRGQSRAGEFEERVTGVELGEALLRLFEGYRVVRVGAHETAVDDHQAGQIPVARPPVEVPRGVRQCGRGTVGVPAQDHLAPACACRKHDPAQVFQQQLQPPPAY